jgi:hypothetical protein
MNIIILMNTSLEVKVLNIINIEVNPTSDVTGLCYLSFKDIKYLIR